MGHLGSTAGRIRAWSPGCSRRRARRSRLVIAEPRGAARNHHGRCARPTEISPERWQEIQKLRSQFGERSTRQSIGRYPASKAEYSIRFWWPMLLPPSPSSVRVLAPLSALQQQALTSNGDEPPLAMRMAVMLQALHKMSEDNPSDSMQRTNTRSGHTTVSVGVSEACGRIRSKPSILHTMVRYISASPSTPRFAQIYRRLSTRYRHLGFSARASGVRPLSAETALQEIEISDHEPKRPATVLLNAAWHRRIRQRIASRTSRNVFDA